MAENIDHIERVKLAIPFDIPWSDKVGLMDVVDVERFFKIWILDTLGDVTSFFLISPSSRSTLFMVLSEGS